MIQKAFAQGTSDKLLPRGQPLSTWDLLKSEVKWVDINVQELDTLCLFNRALKLRAADAGHLFVFDRVLSELFDLRLLTLDVEMANAAKCVGLPLHPESVLN